MNKRRNWGNHSLTHASTFRSGSRLRAISQKHGGSEVEDGEGLIALVFIGKRPTLPTRADRVWADGWPSAMSMACLFN